MKKKQEKTKLRFIIIALASVAIVGSSYCIGCWVPTRSRDMDGVSAQVVDSPESVINFHIWGVFPSRKNGDPSKAVISVSPEHFNEKDMAVLAAQLNHFFRKEKILEAGLVDDETTARLFSAGKVNYATYEKSERGRYFFNKENNSEYIEFSEEPGGVRKRISIKNADGTHEL